MELGRVCLKKWGYDRVDELIWIKTNQLNRCEEFFLKRTFETRSADFLTRSEQQEGAGCVRWSLQQHQAIIYRTNPEDQTS